MIFHLLPNGQGGEVLAAFCDEENSFPFYRAGYDMFATLGCNLKDLDVNFIDGSFESRENMFHPVLVDSLRQADRVHQSRRHFDWLTIRSGILRGAEFLGVGSTRSLREKALQVAILVYGIQVAQMRGEVWNDIFDIYAHISLIRFESSVGIVYNPYVAASSSVPRGSSTSLAIPPMLSKMQAIWAATDDDWNQESEASLSKVDTDSDDVDSARAACAFDVGSGAPMFLLEVGDIVFTMCENPDGIVLKWYTGPPNDATSRAMPPWPASKARQPVDFNLGACTAVFVFHGRAWSRALESYVDMQFQTVRLHHPDTGEEGYVNIWCSHGMHGEPGGVRYARVFASHDFNLFKCRAK